MDEYKHKDELLTGLFKQLKVIFDSSVQGVYLYLDDRHKMCNKQFAFLLGYESEEAWAKVTSSFAQTFIDVESRETWNTSHQRAIRYLLGEVFDITWKKKSGDTVDTKVILIPISYRKNLLTLNFVSSKA